MKAYRSFLIFFVLVLIFTAVLSSCSSNATNSGNSSNTSNNDISSVVSVENDTSTADESDTTSFDESESDFVGLNKYEADRSGARFCVSTGMPYTSSIMWNSGYPDTGTKLTDGMLDFTAHGFAEEWVGYNFSNNECVITIDLGDVVCGILDFEFNYLHETGWGINPPTFVSVFASLDDDTYYPIVSINDISQETGSSTSTTLLLESEFAFDARYISFSFSGTQFVFVDEISVFAYVKEKVETNKIDIEHTKAPDVIDPSLPHITASFINQGQHTAFDVEDWDKHFSYLKDAGIDTAILISGVALEDGKIKERLYPDTFGEHTNDLSDFSPFMGYMLESAQKNGIKCFIGLNVSCELEPFLNDKERMEREFAAFEYIMDDIYSQFGQKYPDALHGWYVSVELNNVVFDKYPDECAAFINGFISAADKLPKSMPILLSPYNVAWHVSSRSNVDIYSEVFSKTDFREGDIFAPQDCVGTEIIAGGGNNAIQNSPKYFSDMRKAIDDTGSKVSLWANCENFINTTDVSLLGYLPANVDRFVEQMRVLENYVDGFGTFMYSNYSPDLANSEYFHYEYIYYLNEGTTKKFTHVKNQTATIENKTEDTFEILYTCENGTYGVSKLLISIAENETSIGINSKMLDKTVYRLRITDILPELEVGEKITVKITPVDYANNEGESISVDVTK